MKTFLLVNVLMMLMFVLLGQFGMWEKFEDRASVVHNYEYRALELAKENRFLKMEISDLKNKLHALDAHKNYLSLKLKKEDRKIASIAKIDPNDLVQYEIYQWAPEKMLSIGNKELFFKNYVKSAQYFQEYLKRFPDHKDINDKVLFEAGIAAYESGKYYDWALDHFGALVLKYPDSRYFRGAKLWQGLSYLNLGQEEKFLSVVEEFRKKYRNTDEWLVLSQYYEDIQRKVKTKK